MIALFPLPAKRREVRLRFSFERALLILLVVVLTYLPNISRFGYPVDLQNGSPLGLTIWSLMYVAAAARLISMHAFAASIHCTRLLCALLALALISTFWSVDPDVTFRNAVAFAGTVVIGFYVAARFELRDFVRLSCLVFFTLAVISIAVQGVHDGFGVAWSGIYADKNHFGGAMVLASLTFLIAALDARGWARPVFLAGFVFSVLCVLRSTSVTSLLILALSIGLLAVVIAFRRTKLPPFALVATIGFLGIVGWAAASIIDVASIIESLGKDTTLTGRTGIWPILWDGVWQRPWLGYGYNGYFSPEGPANDLLGAVGWRPFHAHNSFIQMATSLGFVGLTLFVAIVIVGLWRSIAFAARGELVQAWPFAIIGYLTAVSASETYLGTQNAIEMIFFTAALVYASPYRARERVR